MKVIVVSNINSPTLDSLHCCTNVIENMFGIKLADAADIRKDRLILQVISVPRHKAIGNYLRLDIIKQ